MTTKYDLTRHFLIPAVIIFYSLFLLLALYPAEKAEAVPAESIPVVTGLATDQPVYNLKAITQQQMVITATLDNEIDIDVSSQAVYSSSNDNVAKVSSTGLILAVASGQATVTVTHQGQTKSVKVNVPAVLHSNSLLFNGAGSYVKVADSAALRPATNSLTIEAWIQPKSFSWLAGIVSKYHVSADPSYTLRMDHNWPHNRINWAINDDIGLGPEEISSQRTLSENQWYHVAATYDSGTKKMKLFIDGVLEAEKANVQLETNSNELRIGSDFGDRWFHGEIDEIRIWGYARSQEEITANMNTTLSGNESNLISYWRFDEFGGDTTNDNTGHGNTGTIINAVRNITESTPPGEVTNITSEVSATGVLLNWVNPSDADFAGVVIYRNGEKLIGIYYDSFFDSAFLTVGSTNEYKICTVNANGSPSNGQTIIVNFKDTVAPAAPNGLQASAGDSSVVLNWSPVTDPDLAGYIVYQNASIIAEVTGTTYIVQSLANGNDYGFAVAAVDSSHNQSQQSEIVGARPLPALPATPTGLTAKAGDSKITLSWAPNPGNYVAAYNIYFNGSKQAAVTGSTYVELGNLANGAAYSIQVSAVDIYHRESAKTSPIMAIPLGTDSKYHIFGDFLLPTGEDANGFRVRVYKSPSIPVELSGTVSDAVYNGAQNSAIPLGIQRRIADGKSYMHTFAHVDPGAYSFLITTANYETRVEAVSVTANTYGNSLPSGSPTYIFNGHSFPYLTLSPKASITGISVEHNVLKLKMGELKPIHVTAAYQDGRSKDITQQSLYISSNPEVVQISGSGGIITGQSVGEATITVEYGAYVKSMKVWVGYDAWLRNVLDPNHTGLDVQKLVDFIMKNPRDVTGDNIVNREDIVEMLNVIPAKYIQ